jgi:hypothetical protein
MYRVAPLGGSTQYKGCESSRFDTEELHGQDESRKSPAKKKRATANKAPAKRAHTKQAQLIAMLQRPDGATIDEIVKKLAWRSHTVRGAMAGALKKRLKLKVESEKIDGPKPRLSNRDLTPAGFALPGSPGAPLSERSG